MAVLAVLYSTGGLGDVGRHAVQASLENPDISLVKVLTQHPETLEDKRWNCGCVEDHEFTAEERKRILVVPVESWDDAEFASHFQGVDAVVSCLGTRQPFLGDRPGEAGSQAVIRAMNEHSITRVVAMSSVGILEDSPPLEFFWGGKILSFMFMTVCRREFRDLTSLEEAFRATDLDYLLIRPAGLGEDVVPTGTWALQKEKWKDTVSINLAKLDCARYMVQEALKPTRRRDAVVIGGEEGQSSES